MDSGFKKLSERLGYRLSLWGDFGGPIEYT